jgi:sucrose-6F-phosphate phosphohydrolase
MIFSAVAVIRMKGPPMMTVNRLLLCTDMDRTVIPNGWQTEHPAARETFRQFCRLPMVKLIYVTGRHQQLVQQAIAEYELPFPDYVIADVGTKIYELTHDRWRELLSWQEQIALDWRGQSHEQLRQALNGCTELTLQEQSKQNDFKLSYYLPLSTDHERILTEVEQQLSTLKVDASLIWSLDEQKQTGLLDVLPRNATKLHALQFLQQYLGYAQTEVVFAGDSGNDMPVLASPVLSILVANAAEEIKQQAKQLVQQNDCVDSLYIARLEGSSLGGNYAAGVLQGLEFFVPELSAKLHQQQWP